MLPLHPLSYAASHRRGHLRLRQEPGLFGESGQDTPERGEPCFEEATDRLRELAGDQVRIEFAPRSEDRYGRALFYVYTDAV